MFSTVRTSSIRCTHKWSEVGKVTFFQKVSKSQSRKFLGSFRYRKSANFSGVPIRKCFRFASLQIANQQIFMIATLIANLHISTKLLHNSVSKVVDKLELEHYVL